MPFLSNGDFFEVYGSGNLGKVVHQDETFAWVEWQNFPGKAYPYVWNNVDSSMWLKTDKTFNSTTTHKPINHQMLDKFEKLLNNCKCEFKPYHGISESYEYCIHCDKKRPLTKK